MFGLLATNTIAQGDTREVGLDQLVKQGFVIPRAVASRKWPGVANLEVAHVWVRKGSWHGGYVLEDKSVPGITPFLVVPGKVTGTPYRLAANADKSFIGSYVLGLGFIMTPEEAQALIDRDPRNKDVLYPYLNGEDLNSRWDQSPSRWVINFHDWPLNRTASGLWDKADERQRKLWLQSGIVPHDYPGPVAADHPECLSIILEKVKPERANNNRKVYRDRWWHYAEKRPDLYATIASMDRVLVTARVSPSCVVTWIRPDIVFHEKIVVFPLNQDGFLAATQSTFHWEWARQYTSTLGAVTLNYSPSDCFETFPFPDSLKYLDAIGELYYVHRQSIMRHRRDGLTEVYNRFHASDEHSPDIQRLRELHVEMDRAVADAYGWTDLDLGHDFHETKQGIRFTVSESARREILDRLLALNHQRYAEEVAQGLHDKGSKTKGSPKKAKADQKELF